MKNEMLKMPLLFENEEEIENVYEERMKMKKLSEMAAWDNHRRNKAEMKIKKYQARMKK